MANVFGQQPWTPQPGNEAVGGRQPRRISTPAGYRLSVIMGDNASPPQSARSHETGTGTTMAAAIPPIQELGNDDWKEGLDSEPPSAKTTSTPRVYAASTLSQESSRTEHDPPAQQKRGRFGFYASMSRKRLIIMFGVVITVLLALVIGLAVGIGHSSKADSDDQALSPAPSNGSSPASSPTSSPAANLPKAFPVGTYSMYAFLDTVYTNCTSDAASWTCAPGVTYNENPVQAAATFFFNISGSPGSYQIEPSQSTGLMSGLDFLPHPLQLLDEGQNDERYKFQTAYYKNVTTNLNGTDTICSFPSTTFTGYLFTKMGKTYPIPGQTVPSTSNALWPFRMTFEADNAGGEGASVSCINAVTNEPIHSVHAATFGDTCSCFYRNWRPPIPT